LIWNNELLFLHVPKTGGMSVTDFLLDNLALPVHYTTDSKHRRKKRARFHEGRRHETLVEAEGYFNSMRNSSISDFEVVVAVMRNPYDLEVSRYHYLQKGNAVDKGLAQDLAVAGDFTQYLREAPFFGASPPRIDRYFTIMGSMPDNLRIIRYENLEQDFHRLVGPHLANKRARLPHMNKSARSDWRDYFDEEAEELCYQRHAWFFDKGYYTRFDPAGDEPDDEDERPLYNGATFPDIPEELLGGSALADGSLAARGARVYACLIDELGVEDLSPRRVLDVGCSAALGRDIIMRRRPLQAYLGLDEPGPVLDLLREAGTPEPIAYGSLSVGAGLASAAVPTSASTLVADRFDTVWIGRLLRVLAPADLIALLQLCRNHTTDDAVLVASIALKEPSEQGNAVFDHMIRLGITDELQRRLDVDDPFGPLPNGALLHSRAGLEALFDQGGWTIESISEPRKGLGHVGRARRRD